MLNNHPPVFVGPDRDPFMHGQQGRLLRLVADDESIEDSPAELLARTAMEATSPGRSSTSFPSSMITACDRS